MAQQEFNIEAKEYANLKFRFSYMSPIDICVFASNFDLENYRTSREMFGYAVEHAEVCINEQWIKVKQEKRDVYMPAGMEENVGALLQIVDKFVELYIMPVFQKSSESTTKTL